MSITVDSLVKYYGSQKVLKEASFSVERGQVVGFLGPNGAGKSTMMKILVGLLPPTSGTAIVNDINVADNPIAVKRITGYLPEHNPLYLDMYIREYLEMTAGIYKIPNARRKIDDIIERTGITPERTKKIGQLSKGYRQRVGLAQALLHDPEVLILDEPTTGLDPNQIIDIRNLIKELGKEKTVMLSTHIMQEVEAICNRVIIVDKGNIVANEPITALKLHAQQQQSVLLEINETIDTALLQAEKFIANVQQLDANKFIVQSGVTGDIRPLLFRFAVNNNLTILSLYQYEKQLEDVFRQLTNNKNNLN